MYTYLQNYYKTYVQGALSSNEVIAVCLKEGMRSR